MHEWLLIGFFLGGAAEADSSEGWQIALSQPLATGWIAGLISGQQMYGLILGGLLQLFWLAKMPVGAVRLADFSSAGVCGVILGIMSKTELGLSTTAGIGVSLLTAGTASIAGGLLIHASRKLNDSIVGRMDQQTSLPRVVLSGMARSFLRGGVLCVVVISMWSAVASALSRIESVRLMGEGFPTVFAVSAFALGAAMPLVSGRFRFAAVGFVTALVLVVSGVI
jgi:mannose/fructose/N-acetylgalactosamine-specific phosphotransferase system component IIC